MFLHFFRQISKDLTIHEVPPAILRKIPILTTLAIVTLYKQIIKVHILFSFLISP